jgi:AraC family transcriptional regulator
MNLQSATESATDAVVGLGRLFGQPPALIGEPLKDKTRRTGRFRRGEVHDSLDGLSGHVLITYYGQSCRVVWRTNGRPIAARTRRGAISLIPEGHYGHWDVEAPIEVSHVYLSDQRLQAVAEQVAGGRRVELMGRLAFEDPTASRIMELLSREAAYGDLSSLFVEQAVDLLCLHLVRSHSNLNALAPEGPRGGLAGWQVKRVREYMRAHLDEEIGLDQIATIVSLSRFHFCTAFRKATGQTPHNWLVMQRIEESRRLLDIGALPVTEVALAVGYQTPSSFAAAFRKLIGMTPTEYRRRRLQ